jgi:hypothetical protein
MASFTTGISENLGFQISTRGSTYHSTSGLQFEMMLIKAESKGTKAGKPDFVPILSVR